MRVGRHPASTIIIQTRKTNLLEAVDNAKAPNRGPPRALIPYGTIVLNKTTVTACGHKKKKRGVQEKKISTLNETKLPPILNYNMN